MLILPQTVEIMCRPSNKKHFEEKGYDWKYNQKITVNVQDLSKSSKAKVNVFCDYCLDNGVENVITPAYAIVYKNKLNNKRDCCVNCQSLKVKDVMLDVYGVENAMSIPRVKNVHLKRIEAHKHKLEDIEKEFDDRGYKLISTVYINNHGNLEYICLKHEEKGIQDISHANFSQGSGCYFCGRERTVNAHVGEKSHHWKGGVSPLRHYLREKMFQWKRDSLIECDFKCVITNEKSDLEVHHLYNFSIILEETMKQLDLKFKNKINDYTDKELNDIEELIIKKHYDYGLGVALRKDIHKLFHAEYGISNNTPEQFEEFKLNYQNGKYEKSVDEAV